MIPYTRFNNIHLKATFQLANGYCFLGVCRFLAWLTTTTINSCLARFLKSFEQCDWTDLINSVSRKYSTWQKVDDKALQLKR